MKNRHRVLSVILATLFVMTSFCIATSAAAADVEGIIADKLEAHREFANGEQEAALLPVEAENVSVVSREYTEAPWISIVSGDSSLLTDAILDNLTVQRTLTLEYMRGKEIGADVADSSDVNTLIEEFETKNNAIEEKYNVGGLSVSDSAKKFSEMEAELTSIYQLYLKIDRELEKEGVSFTVDGVSFAGLSKAQCTEMMSVKITNLFKDINSLLFATKETWENAYKELLSDENKKTLGLILGGDSAAELAKADTFAEIEDYLESTDVLKTVASYQVDLYSSDFSKSNTAFYGLCKDVMDDVLSLSALGDTASALEGIGWSTEKIAAAMKVSQDAADPQFISRAINLNMILGRYLSVYYKDKAQSPVIVNQASVEKDEYDVCVAKDNYKASVLNVIDAAVYDQDALLDKLTVSDDEGSLKFEVSENFEGEGYTIKFFRDKGEKTVENYIGADDLKVVYDDSIHVESVSIKQGTSMTVNTGRIFELEAIISPVKATNKKVTWESDNESVATVDEDGYVRAISPGVVNITVTTEDGGYTATIEITVRKRTNTGGTTGGGTTVTPVTPVTPVIPGFTPQGSADFADMKEHWASSDIDELIKAGIVQGYGDNTFLPDKPITRAEFAVIICKMMKVPITTTGVVYSDTENHWAKNYVATATKYGYMIGVAEDLFAPDRVIPREQVIAVILRVVAFGTEIMHEGNVITNNAEDILNLVKAHFGYEYTDLSDKVSDINAGSEWARAYLEISYKNGFCKGYEDCTMRPLENATRAEAMVMAKRAIFDK